ncbi:MAG: glycosyltransferase family 4 protein [Planctomycetota bacterium]|nr:glycosyltransferase family 4 protein [Planctomycetota bacterium]
MEDGRYIRDGMGRVFDGMTILQVVSTPRNSGPGAAALIECRAIRDRGGEVLLLAEPGGSLERECRRHQIPFLPLPEPGGAPFAGISRIAGALASVVADYQPRVIHAHRTREQIAATILLRGGRRGTALVRGMHRPPFSRSGLLSRLAMSGLDGLVLPCTDFLASFKNRTSSFPAAVAVLQGGVDVAEYRPDRRSEEVRRQLTASGQDVPLVGLVSRFKEGRRFELFFRAIAMLPPDLPFAAACIGRGEREAELQGLARTMGLEGRLSVTDPGRAYADAVASLDVGVALDPGSDGSSRPALEMFASGVPVVGFRRGAISDLVLDGKCGLLVPDGDAAALACGIARLLRDRELRSAMGAAALERARRDFSLEALGRRLLEFYAEVAGSHAC